MIIAMQWSRRIFLVARNTRRQLHPGMFPALVNRIFRRRESRICECTDRNEHDGVVAFLRVEHIAPTDWAEPEPKRRPLIALTGKFRSGTENLVGRSISGERGKNASRSLLTSKAVTNTAAQRFSVNVNAELPTKAGCGFGQHENLEEMIDLLLRAQALTHSAMTSQVFA